MPDSDSRHIWWLRLAVGSLLLGLVACSSSPETSWDDPGPEARFENFLMNWFRYDREKAFEMIAPEDRQALTRSLDEVSETLGGDVLAPHEMLVAGRVDNPYDLERVETSRELESRPEAGTRVELSLVYHDGRTGEATMVWRDDTWFVDLPLGDEAGADSDHKESESGTDESQGEPAESMDAEIEDDDVQGESRE